MSQSELITLKEEQITKNNKGLIGKVLFIQNLKTISEKALVFIIQNRPKSGLFQKWQEHEMPESIFLESLKIEKITYIKVILGLSRLEEKFFIRPDKIWILNLKSLHFKTRLVLDK